MANASEPPPAPATTPSLRDRTIRAVRAEISDAAIVLFREHGYDETTVEQIASAAGMSRTSFFRYFGSKEEVILGRFDTVVEQMHEALAARPQDEPVWVALRRAADALVADIDTEPRERRRVLRALYCSQPLRARELARRLRWYELLVPEVARRMGIADPAADPRPQATVGAAIACLAAAVEVWSAAEDESANLAELLDLSMSAPWA